MGGCIFGGGEVDEVRGVGRVGRVGTGGTIGEIKWLPLDAT